MFSRRLSASGAAILALDSPKVRIMKSLLKTLVMAFIGSGLTVSALAQSAVYSCRDEHGNRSYSQIPCNAGTQSLEVKTLGRNALAEATRTGPKTGAEPTDTSQASTGAARRANETVQPGRKSSPS